MLDVNDINLKERTAFIRYGKGKKQYLAVFSEDVKRLLQNYLTAIRPLWKNANETNALFINEKGNRLGVKGIETAMKKYVNMAELNPKYTPHSLRKYLVTSLVKANANPAHIQRLMNWDSLRPLKNYARMSVEDLKKTLDECHPLAKKMVS